MSNFEVVILDSYDGTAALKKEYYIKNESVQCSKLSQSSYLV